MRRNQPEAALLLSVIKHLKAFGWYVGKIKTKGGFGKGGRFFRDPYLLVGAPDAMAFRDDTCLAVETKAGSNTQTPEQQSFQEHFHCPPGRIYLIVRELSDIDLYLTR